MAVVIAPGGTSADPSSPRREGEKPSLKTSKSKSVLASSFSWNCDLEEDDDILEVAAEDTPRFGDGSTPLNPALKRGATTGFGTGGNGKVGKGAKRRDGRCARFTYVLERVMSEYGRWIQIPLLLLTGALQVVAFGLIYASVWRYEDDADPRDEERVNRYIEGFWAAWTFMSDGGTHARVFHAEQRIIGGLITVFGIIYLATVLAFIVDMVREKMDSMRVGKGQVHEFNHTVILHWTDRTIPLLYELCVANESEGGGVVVVLAKDSIQTMQVELSVQLPEFVRRGTKIVLRHGNPAVVSDLIKVSVDRAKAVVCLASGRTADESDSATLRCILSLKSIGYPIKGHIVAEVQDVDNEPLLQLVGGRLIETFVAHDVVGRLMLMSVRQLGLANVYDALLGFEGNEFYMKAWPELTGVPFGELIERLPQAVPIGVRSATGEISLNPSRSYRLLEDDQLIVIAEDDHTYKPEEAADVELGELVHTHSDEPRSERILICGWRRDIRDILKLLDGVVRCKSEVHTMTHCVPVEKRNLQLREEGLLVSDLHNIALIHHGGNTSVRRRLELLPLETYSSCLIFADQAYEDDTMQADSHSLATLVLIRDIQAQRQNEVTCPITCEVLDLRTQRTIAGQKQLSLLSDFVQSNKFVARILAMIAEARSVNLILCELLGATGCSLVIVPATDYVHQGERISFWTVAKRVQHQGCILLGFQSTSSSKKTVLNPVDKTYPRKWDALDLAVISGNATRRPSLLDEKDQEDVLHSSPLASMANRRLSDSVQPDVFKEAGDAPAINGYNLARALEACPPSHLREQIFPEGEDDSTAGGFTVPEEGGVCASADTAIGAMAKLANKFARLMTESEQQRLGSSLIHLGHRLRDGKLTMQHGVRELLSTPRGAQ